MTENMKIPLSVDVGHNFVTGTTCETHTDTAKLFIFSVAKGMTEKDVLQIEKELSLDRGATANKKSPFVLLHKNKLKKKEFSTSKETAVIKITEVTDINKSIVILNKCIKISLKDLNKLSSQDWLNDNLINFYLCLVMERSHTPDLPSVYVFNSFFFTSLTSRGASEVLRWTSKISGKKTIFDFNIVFIPIHLKVHWALCAIDNRSKEIKYYDSLRNARPVTAIKNNLVAIKNYLILEAKNKSQPEKSPKDYKLEIVQNIPRQKNDYDCGMFTLKYAEFLSRDAPFTFDQSKMRLFRRTMIQEIFHKEIISPA